MLCFRTRFRRPILSRSLVIAMTSKAKKFSHDCYILILLLSVVQQPFSGIGRLSVEVPRSHTQTLTPGKTPVTE